MYKRTGECNLCGECCGYPRATDNGQTPPFPVNLPECVSSWSNNSDKEKAYPMFKITGHKKRFGKFNAKGEVCHWIWIKGKGLCKDVLPFGDETTYDVRCPFLSKKLPDGTVPCLIYQHELRVQYCSKGPQDTYENKLQVEHWFKNYPSCSFIYEEIE